MFRVLTNEGLRASQTPILKPEEVAPTPTMKHADNMHTKMLIFKKMELQVALAQILEMKIQTFYWYWLAINFQVSRDP